MVGAEFTIRESPTPTPRLTVVSGGGQTAPPGTSLPLPIVVEVLGADGRPAVGQTVNFAIGIGSGQVSPASATTNSLGRASTSWTLGSSAGVQTMTAATASIAPVTISAVAASSAGSGVQVRISTTGSDLPDALTFYVANCDSGFDNECHSDLGPPTRVAPNGTFSLNLAPGRYLFYILELPLNCAVASPQQVTVAGAPVVVAFNVTCFRAGTIRVSAPTTGTDPATSYSITVDGSWAADIAPGASASIRASEGSHSVQLTQIAPNCTVTGPNPATVNLIGGAVTDVAFPVSCTPNPTLQVTVTTTGTHIPAQYFARSGLLLFLRLLPLRLDGAGQRHRLDAAPARQPRRESCRGGELHRDRANPLSVTMSLGATASVAFTVVCR